MSFFNKKTEIKLEDFCRDFYNKNILDGTVQGIDVNDTYYKGFQNLISEVLPEFSDVDFEKLKEEFTALRFELFSLAWQHTFSEDISVDQSIFTIYFIGENSKQNIWDKMQFYNNAIAYSIKARHLSTNTGRVGNAMLDKNRADFVDKYTKKKLLEGKVLDDTKGFFNSISRVANRISSKGNWNDGTIAYFLSFTLLKNLGFSDDENQIALDNKEILSRLISVIKGFYNGAKESWEDIKII
jgi:hypothetical protein